MPYVADGLTLPIRIGGHAALDFCNTRSWDDRHPHEFLTSYRHLTVWARENGLITAAAVPRLHRAAAREPGAAAAVLARAATLRAGLRAVLVGPARPRDWAAVNAEVHEAAAPMVLRPGTPATRPGTPARRSNPLGSGLRPPAAWELPDATGLARPLLAVAWAAADLLTSPLVATVAVCPGHGCGGLFSDPRGRRRWCSMSLCGNRAKVRRFAARTREPAPTREPPPTREPAPTREPPPTREPSAG